MREPRKGPTIAQGQWVTLVQTCALSMRPSSDGRAFAPTVAVYFAMKFPCEHIPLRAAWASWNFTLWVVGRGDKPEWVPDAWAAEMLNKEGSPTDQKEA